MQFFLHHLKGGYADFTPDLPEGMPLKMFLYHQFYAEAKWHPRQVDQLTLEEEYWLPVLHAASNEASGTWF